MNGLDTILQDKKDSKYKLNYQSINLREHIGVKDYNEAQELVNYKIKRKYKTPQELATAINNRIETEQELDNIPTVSGLCYFLNIDSKTLDNYELMGDYYEPIQKAKQFMERYLSQLALKNKVNTTFSIFYMKARHGLSDRGTEEQDKSPKQPIININIDTNKLD